jgi:hypothetical protein
VALGAALAQTLAALAASRHHRFARREWDLGKMNLEEAEACDGLGIRRSGVYIERI